MLEIIYRNKMQFFALAIFLVILTMMSSVSAEDYDISITDDMKFNPDDLTINVDDTVTWTNNDGMGHTATSTDGPASFDSGNIAAGATWSFTFIEAGTYDYKCNYHSSMTATITVVESDSGDENITVNHVTLVDTPPHKEWEWNYSYQVEVSDLQLDVNYIAVILIKLIDDDEWGGADWWWDDIEGNGDQYNYTVSLQRECYFINASLYERDDLNSNGENATVLASAYLDFVVGTGSCVDGVYSEDDNAEEEEENENNETAEEEEENEETGNNETEDSPDSDNDGISDDNDLCPEEDASGHDADADGCIDDSDDDGIKNNVDECPFDATDTCDATLQNQENFCPDEITDENKDTVDDSCIATFDEPEEYEPEEGLLSSISFFVSICVMAIISFRRKNEN